MPYLGPDTIELIFRDPAPGVDANGQPNVTDRVVSKGNCALMVTTATEREGVTSNTENGMITRYVAKAVLPVDADTTALRAVDAIRFDGRVYELSADAVAKYTLRGAPDHVRIFATCEVATPELGELVTITPKFGRDDTGQPLPDGDPFDVIARAVTPGNTAKTLGVAGEQDAADFTVVFDAGVPIKDGDAVTVRGRRGIARVALHIEQWANRDTIVALVKSRTGGRR
ncbi:head-to-tail connector [Mycobacterium phage Evanesce]|uniref:Head-to-tail stopper n=14 Tax=Caudoviricetes TaxID=2731619 RepID=A0A8T8JBG3_9CAUD|nr:head closure Hc1 [Mycobacterium phage Giles]AHY84197.1 hypothetical protein PBI_HH92_12 [Mycobacterium phage HH92]AKQ07788.1 head-to-tail connector [Mycobacterium phage Kinbote]ALA06656.1 hypothetical protein SEA_OBUpride_12 [Mycobacterium phage OBUpride]ALF00233.1 head-to-tail connector [Mycobacterium phage Evanesce]ATN90370.1 head-to-tail connector protein [Mycobacterium phage LilHazelnut]QBQ71215.1 head-to-tail stopper [Mycobacterium phage Daegal]QDH48752.1 head-to-tail stopper [Mycoba